MRIHFTHPESDGKSSDIGVGGRIGILRLSLKCKKRISALLGLVLSLSRRLKISGLEGAGKFSIPNDFRMFWRQLYLELQIQNLGGTRSLSLIPETRAL